MGTTSFMLVMAAGHGGLLPRFWSWQGLLALGCCIG